MGVPTSEVGYTAAMPRREDHKGHVVALDQKKNLWCLIPSHYLTTDVPLIAETLGEVVKWERNSKSEFDVCLSVHRSTSVEKKTK